MCRAWHRARPRRCSAWQPTPCSAAPCFTRAHTPTPGRISSSAAPSLTRQHNGPWHSAKVTRYVGYGTWLRGWALAIQGQGEAGLAQMHQGLAAILATGQRLAQPRGLVLLAEATGHTGQVAEGLRLLAESLVALEASGQGDLLAEAYRLKGEFLLRQALPDASQAEACFQQALAVARHQQAKSWELRVALSLSRLWQRQGKRTEARELLAPLYGWFTEGFDTADLQEAKALLTALA